MCHKCEERACWGQPPAQQRRRGTNPRWMLQLLHWCGPGVVRARQGKWGFCWDGDSSLGTDTQGPSKTPSQSPGAGVAPQVTPLVTSAAMQTTHPSSLICLQFPFYSGTEPE